MCKVCSLCHGRGGDVEIQCRDCGGTGYDPNEDNAFAQCHTCYGEGYEEVEVCPRCGGSGEIYEDDFDYDEEDDDFDDDVEKEEDD